MRVIAGLSYREDCKAAFQSLMILTFPSVYILENLLYVKKNIEKFRSHGELHGYDTRNRDNLAVIYKRLKKCQTGSEFLGVKLFNKLSLGARALPLTQIKQKIKVFLAKQAFYSVQEFLDCNVCI
jgi:hypothetical protein